MALKIPIVIKGVKVEYWKISAVSATYTGEVAQIYIMGYIDKAARDTGVSNSFTVENYICKPDKFSQYFGTEESLHVGNFANTLQASYSFLKDNVQEFKDAVDC